MLAAKTLERIRALFTQYILFMIPAMLLAAKGYADLWIAAQRQPYIALSLLMLSLVAALMLLTLASALHLLARRNFWTPPGKLIVLVAGMKLFFDCSLGTTLGLVWIVLPLGLWFLWGALAYRKVLQQTEQP